MTYLVKPFPSSRTTIQHAGNSASSNSNCFTYSKRLLAIQQDYPQRNHAAQTDPNAALLRKLLLALRRYGDRKRLRCVALVLCKRLRVARTDKLSMGGKRAATVEGLQHPQGVQPWGNYLFTQGRDTRNEGAFRSSA